MLLTPPNGAPIEAMEWQHSFVIGGPATKKVGETEEQFRERIVGLLSPHFIFRKEWEGVHFSGRRLVLDLICRPKEPAAWKNGNLVFGIEFKAREQLKSLKDFTAFFAQAVDYAHTDWGKVGYVPIFVCPSIPESLAEYSVAFDGQIGLMARLLSQFGVGEFYDHPRYGLAMYWQGSHRLWSEKNGVEAGKTYNLLRKFGSR